MVTKEYIYTKLTDAYNKQHGFTMLLKTISQILAHYNDRIARLEKAAKSDSAQL